VASVLQQDGVAVRVLIIDDCSSDNTPEVGLSLAVEDPRVEYRRHESNQGHVATYNEGLEWVLSDAALLLSADDLLVPGALSRAMHVMEIHPEVGLVFGRQIVIDDTFRPTELPSDWTCEIISGTNFIERICGTGHNPVSTPTVVVRTTVLRDVGGYNCTLPHSGDLEYWLRSAARSSIGILDAYQAYKRLHGCNMQLEFVLGRVRDLEQLAEAFRSFFERDGGQISNATSLYETARRSLARKAFWSASEAFEMGRSSECDTLLRLAKNLCPNLPNQKSWSRLAWKRRIGIRAWRAIRPLFN
jgi:glycosyltransferase involved in cell wall biosynthesis